MNRLTQVIATLLLLSGSLFAAPGFANAPQQDILDSVQATHTALADAKSAQAQDPDNTELSKAYDTAKAAYADSLKAARDARQAGGQGNSGEFGLALYEISGEAPDASSKGMARTAGKWMDQAKNWLTEAGPPMAISIAFGLLILLVFRILAGIAASLTGKALGASRLKVSDLLKKFFVGAVRKLIFFVGIMIALEQVGVNTAPLLAGLGVVGFVIGFALQDTLSNFAAGIMILLYRPYDVGDFISAAGESGSVETMSLVSTTLSTPDNQRLIVPNSAIWGATIRNITAQTTRRVDLVVGVGYGDDLDRAQEVLLEVISAHALVLKSPGPMVRVSNLGESSVDFVVRPWCKTGDYWEVLWDLNKAIKQRLDAEGISIPYPQRDLHLVQVPNDLKSAK
ncbi:MAG: small conductance mechanosensitive channel [Candidatus Paceibacteria bacterium]|jgi:small conductance mechanosensitive channel